MELEGDTHLKRGRAVDRNRVLGSLDASRLVLFYNSGLYVAPARRRWRFAFTITSVLSNPEANFTKFADSSLSGNVIFILGEWWI